MSKLGSEHAKKYWDSPAGLARREKLRKELKGVGASHNKRSKSAGSQTGAPGESPGMNTTPPGGVDMVPPVEKPVDKTPPSEAAKLEASGVGKPSETVRVSSKVKPTGDMLPPPGGARAPGSSEKKGKHEAIWKPAEPTPEEFTNLTKAFTKLIDRGYDTLADVRSYPDWHHTQEELEPHGVVIRYALKRLKFDPGLLLVVLAVMEIVEIDGRKLAGDLKMHAQMKKAAESAKDQGVNKVTAHAAANA